MRYLVCGSRGFKSYPILVDALDNIAMLNQDETIIEGCAPGADRLAEKYGREQGIEVEHHPAAWRRLGKRAGYVRNIEMLESGIACVVAFWDGTSPGTAHTIREAHLRGIPVEVVPF